MFKLPDLPYDLDALEPHLSRQELELHHGKHHKAYVENLNKLVKGTTFEGMELEQIIRDSEKGPIFNNAAQHWNHTFYWKCMSPNSKFDAESDLGKAIEEQFGSFEDFKKKFKDSAVKLFGSGWCWLVVEDDKLAIKQTKNAETVIIDKSITPLFTCDVWEHAYLYMDKYFANRPEYIENFFEVIDWKFATVQYKGKE